MRAALVLAMLIVAAGAAGQEPEDAVPDRRYGLEVDPEKYPQATPKEALASALEAVEARRFDYLLAHLADPKWVEERVAKLGSFEAAVRETRAKLTDDPDTVRLWKRFLKEGEWQGGEDEAAARLKDVPGRALFFRKAGKRWFLENRQKSKDGDN